MVRGKNIEFRSIHLFHNMYWALGVGNTSALKIAKVSSVTEFAFWLVTQTVNKARGQRHKAMSDGDVGCEEYKRGVVVTKQGEREYYIRQLVCEGFSKEVTFESRPK